MKKLNPAAISNILINAAVFLCVLLGLGNIFFIYYRKFWFFEEISEHYSFFTPEELSLHRTLSVVIGFSLVFISYRLYKRMKTAWIISLGMVSASFFMHLIKINSISSSAIISELVVIVILIFNYRSFKKASDPISLKHGMLLGLIVAILIVINTGFTVYILRIRVSTIKGIDLAVMNTLKMLFLFDTSIFSNLPRRGVFFVKSSIWINWTGIAAALLFVLKPLIYQPIVTAMDKEKVRKLLKEYADNPISYVSMESDKKYYFGNNVEGVIVYVVAAGVAVCAGDPVCSEEALPLLVTEFITYCKQNDLDILFCQTLERHISIYSQFGFGITKYGEEAMFDLETYNLVGGKAAKIRNAVNHATSLGIIVLEYKPLESRDKLIEQQISNISKEWLINKKSSELSFMLGSISLDNPMDRRYFAAYDSEGKMLGFIVFSPFAGGKGYFADVTRRNNDAPIGVMEKITIEAFNKMKAEGVKWGSLGLAPLANVAGDGKMAGKLLEFVYEKLNNFYGFKSLHHYKKKYGPTSWESRYLAYYPRIFTPKIAYSIIKAQNPKGVGDYILSQLKLVFSGK